MVTGDAARDVRRGVEGLLVFAGLLAITWVTFGRAFDIRPLGGDNLYVLSWANRAPASSLLRVDPVIYPEWRPLAYVTVWLQYAWSGIDSMFAYHLVNLLLWTGCAWLVYRIVVEVSASWPAGTIAAVLVMTDLRSITAQTLIIERQSTMAALFGLGALWVLSGVRDRRLGRGEWIAVFLLCLASALSKEYGLAVAGAIGLFGLTERRWDLVTAGAMCGLMYGALRMGFAGGADGPYCENMGYFFVIRKVCYSAFDATSVKQMAYNVGATGIGTVLPGLFTADGKLGLAPLRLAASAIWLGIGVLGWIKGPKLSRVVILVAVCNTALSFMVYGSRNQITAVCAFGIVVGIGMALLDDALRTRAAANWWRAAALTAAAGVVCVQGLRTRAELGEQVADFLTQDPCSEIMHPDQHDPVLIHQIKLKYGMSDPECARGR